MKDNSISVSNEDELDRLRRQKVIENAAEEKKGKAEEATAEETTELGDDIFSRMGIDIGQVVDNSISASNEDELDRLRRQKAIEHAAAEKKRKAEEAAAEERSELGDDIFSRMGIDVGQVVNNST